MGTAVVSSIYPLRVIVVLFRSSYWIVRHFCSFVCVFICLFAVYKVLIFYDGEEHEDTRKHVLYCCGVVYLTTLAMLENIALECWIGASFICNRSYPQGKVHTTIVTPAMMHGAEPWASKKAHEKKLDVAESRKLGCMCGVTTMDRIRNETSRETTKV